jgi:hypothetical protein
MESNMICKHVIDLIPFLNDGSLAPKIEKEVMDHLAVCENCHLEYHKLNNMIKVVCETIMEQAPVPDSKYVEMVTRRIKKKKAERTTALWAVPAAAAILFAVFLGTHSMFFGNDGAGLMAGKKHTNHGQTSIVTNNPSSEVDLTYHSFTTYANVSLDDMLNSMDENEIEALIGSEER